MIFFSCFAAKCQIQTPDSDCFAACKKSEALQLAKTAQNSRGNSKKKTDADLYPNSTEDKA